MHFINFNVAIATAPSRPIGEKTDAGDYQIYPGSAALLAIFARCWI
jgi:hypothetical protein